jgi:hypothetical protein
VVLGAVLLLPSTGDAHPRAQAAAACSNSFVDATVYNDTSLRMDPYFFGYGLTNSVCDDQHPGSVQPHSSGHWKVGDNFFGTSVKIRYRLTNGDEVELNVVVTRLEETLTCGWTQVVSSPRAYDCSAGWRVTPFGGSGRTQIQLEVFPVGARVRHTTMRARSAVVRRCLHGSELIGTTTNQTGVRLRLVSVRHGRADAWCQAPGRSQAEHSAGHWKLGGPRAGASARFIYRLPNGDEVDFAVAVNPRRGTIGCAPLDHARARRFGCRAVRGGPMAVKHAQKGSPAPGTNGEAPTINLEVFPIRARK